MSTLLDTIDQRLIQETLAGLQLVPRPWAELADRIGISEQEVLQRIGRLQAQGIIKRLGLVMRHRSIGYCANAMVVWEVAEADIQAAAAVLAGLPYVNLCYRRRTYPGIWPYNLYCMIHGKARSAVLDLVEQATDAAGLQDVPRSVLFSQKEYKLSAGMYIAQQPEQETNG